VAGPLPAFYPPLLSPQHIEAGLLRKGIRRREGDIQA
jgi:hypothetical protein